MVPRAEEARRDHQPPSFHILADSLALSKNRTLLFSSDPAIFRKNTLRGGWSLRSRTLYAFSSAGSPSVLPLTPSTSQLTIPPFRRSRASPTRCARAIV